MTGTERRVVVSGIGLVTALGEGPAANWKALTSGAVGVRPIQAYDTSTLQTRLGAEIDDFDERRFATRRQLNTLNRGDALALAAARLALGDAGVDVSGDLGDRTGLFLGGNKEIGRLLDDLIAHLGEVRRQDGTADARLMAANAQRIMAPLFFVEGLQPGAVFHVSQTFGIRGSNAFFAGTADAGATAIGRAVRAVRRGEADLAVAGGYDDATTWWSMSKMDRIGVLTTRNELGAEAFRPYDRDRSGAVLGEGAALMVVEDRERALARGARIYAEVTGYGAGHEAVTPPSLDPSGRGLARAIRASLRDARRPVDEIDYVASHGAATQSGDASESAALRSAFGPAADRLMISTVKPQTGHLVGGAGALNAVVAALALYHGAVPANANLHAPAPECDLDYVRGAARESRPRHAMALARGLEGQAVALILARAA
jgi:3-oxoacyl-[acyl-carrier-protein] synthase II